MDCQSFIVDLEQLQDIKLLEPDKLHEILNNLMEQNKFLKNAHEENMQHIYNLKRQLETAISSKNYLEQELETVLVDSQNNAAVGETKLAKKLEQMEFKYARLSDDYKLLQDEYSKVQLEIADQKINSSRDMKRLSTSNTEYSGNSDGFKDIVDQLEKENAELLLSLQQYKELVSENQSAVAEHAENEAVLKEKITCLEANLRAMSDELEETSNLLESTQSQLFEAKTELAGLKSEPQNIERKGNSLFAEVDDQRQMMRRMLADQKAEFNKMKKEIEQSERNARRFKQENLEMCTELHAISKVYLNADKIYHQKLRDRIGYLIIDNDRLHNDLRHSDRRVREWAKNEGAEWINNTFDICKKEVHELSQALHKTRLDKARSEEQLRDVVHKMASWRLESLQNRARLKLLESILEEHKIDAKEIKDSNSILHPKEVEKAFPQIELKRLKSIFSKPSIAPIVTDDESDSDTEENIVYDNHSNSNSSQTSTSNSFQSPSETKPYKSIIQNQSTNKLKDRQHIINNIEMEATNKLGEPNKFEATTTIEKSPCSETNTTTTIMTKKLESTPSKIILNVAPTKNLQSENNPSPKDEGKEDVKESHANLLKAEENNCVSHSYYSHRPQPLVRNIKHRTNTQSTNPIQNASNHKLKINIGGFDIVAQKRASKSEITAALASALKEIHHRHERNAVYFSSASKKLNVRENLNTSSPSAADSATKKESYKSHKKSYDNKIENSPVVHIKMKSQQKIHFEACEEEDHNA